MTPAIQDVRNSEDKYQARVDIIAGLSQNTGAEVVVADDGGAAFVWSLIERIFPRSMSQAAVGEMNSRSVAADG